MFQIIADTYVKGLIPSLIEKTSASFDLAIFVLGLLLCALCGYVLGSFNFALILSKKMYGEDIREYGSKNAGTTNMMRTYGKKAAFLTIFGDIAKGIVAVAIGSFAMGVTLGGYLAGLFCILGHIFPVFYGFKGGKGVATAVGIILMLNPFVIAVMLGVFIITVALSRYISLGSVLAAAIFPLLTYSSLFGTSGQIAHKGFAFIFSFLMALVVIIKHYENLYRLAHGTENKFSFKKSKKSENDTQTFKAKKKK